MSKVKETTFRWTINNFDACPHVQGEQLRSPIFSVDIFKSSRFSLSLFPRGYDNSDYVSLYINRHHDDAATIIRLEYQLCIIDTSGKRINTQRSESSFWKSRTCGVSKFYERNLLLHNLRHNILLENDFTVECRLSPVPSKTTSARFPTTQADTESLSRDFDVLLESGIHSDLTVRVPARDFKVHKAILEARWPQLMAKLSEDTSILRLSEKVRVLQALLRYFYTGTLRGSEITEEVIVATHRYKLPDLKASLFPHPSHFEVSTAMDSFHVSFDWTIANFHAVTENTEVSCFLFSDEMPESCWMKISLIRTLNDNQAMTASLLLQKIRKNMITNFQLHASDGTRRLKLVERGGFEGDEFSIPLHGEAILVQTVVSGNLHLHFKISTAIKKTCKVKHLPLYSVSLDTCSAGVENWDLFQENLRHFFENMKFGDLILCIGSKKFPAHKPILCARSQVFCKMFEHECLEKRRGIVKIEDVDVETMASLMMYAYCGLLYENMFFFTSSIKLYAAADKYQILSLKEKCCQYMKSIMNAHNVGRVLILADTHNDESLKKIVYDYMTSHAAEVLKSGLSVLENRVDLYRDIVNSLLQFISTNTVPYTEKKKRKKEEKSSSSTKKRKWKKLLF